MVAGGMHGCSGACVVVGGVHGCQGGVCGCQGVMHGWGHAWWGVCVVAGGCAWLQGACMVARGGCVWLGVCVWLWGACMVAWQGVCAWLSGGMHRISCTRSSPTGGNFYFAVLKSFEYKIAISANFVQTVKNLNVSRLAAVRKQWLFFNSRLELTELNVFTARKQSLGQGNNFTPVCHSFHREGQGGVRGSRGACMVAWGAFVVARGACLVVGVCMVARGVCVVAGGVMHGWGRAWWGVCMVAGGYAWLQGGLYGCQRGGVCGWGCVWLQGLCMVAWQGGVCMVVGGGMHRIR